MIIQLTPRNLLNVIFRHRGKIAISFGTCVCAAVAYNFLAATYYQPRADLLVKFGKQAAIYQSQDDANNGSNNTPLDRKEIVNSQVKILESRDLIGAVLKQIGVGTIYPDLISDPPHRGTPLDAAIDRFGSNLTVDTPRDTNVIEVSLFDKDPQVGTRAVNLLVDHFIERDLKLFGNPQSSFLQQQLDFFRKQVASAEKAVAQYKIDNHISSIDEERTQYLKLRTDLQNTYSNVVAHVAELGSKKDGLAKALQNTKQNVELYSESNRYRSIDDAKQKLLDLQSRLRNLLSYYTDNAPPVIAVRQEIKQVEDSLKSDQKAVKDQVRMGKNEVYQQIQLDLLRNNADLVSAQASAAEMKHQLDDLDSKLQTLESEQAKLANLNLQLEVANQNYKTYMQRNEDARIAEDLNREKIASIAVIQKAEVPIKPARPRHLLNLALGIVLGGFIGLILAFLSEAFDDAYSTPEQIEHTIGVPVLVSVSEAGRRTRRRAA